MTSLKFVGHVTPSTILVTSEESCLETVRGAWARKVLRAPSSYTIVLVGKSTIHFYSNRNSSAIANLAPLEAHRRPYGPVQQPSARRPPLPNPVTSLGVRVRVVQFQFTSRSSVKELGGVQQPRRPLCLTQPRGWQPAASFRSGAVREVPKGSATDALPTLHSSLRNPIASQWVRQPIFPLPPAFPIQSTVNHR